MNIADQEKTTDKRLSSAPPYIAYKTFRNFVDSLRITMPGRIDRSVMHTMSGGAQGQMMHALRTMDLVSQHGIPTEAFKKLVSAEADERKKALAVALHIGYPFLFSDSVNLATATGKQLLEQFAGVGLTGDTVRRSVSFFLAAAKDAGITLSPYFRKIQSRSNPAKRTGANGGLDTDDADASRQPRPKTIRYMTGRAEQRKPPERELPVIPAQESLLLWGLFQRLPKPGAVWPPAQREQWLQTLQNVFSLEYRDEE